MDFLDIVIWAGWFILGYLFCRRNNRKNDIKQNETSMFVEIECTDIWKVVYHKETKVMYAISSSGDNYGNFTLLVNADGSPMLWEE